MLTKFSYPESNQSFENNAYMKICFKVSSDNHYTIGEGSIFNPYTRGLRVERFERSHLTIVGLKSTPLDHSGIHALVVMCPTHPHYNRTPHFYTLFKVYTISFL